MSIWPAVAFGFFSGFLLATASGWMEFFERLHLAQYGDPGEAVNWGEYLLYIILLGTPAGFIGGMAGSMIAAFVNWRRTSSGHGGER